MTRSATHHREGSDFDPFLCASVGADQRGSTVSVLSTLARLGLDPWEEAADLSVLSIEVATSRLSALLQRSRDVPSLVGEHEATARELMALLPNKVVRHHRPTSQQLPREATKSYVWIVIATAFLLIVLIKSLTPSISGTGRDLGPPASTISQVFNPGDR